mmetsp:Transcript_19281/g.47292  ORF Transcript_19281/g.47292 Transcript_19281/m.47292 type:complete len:346 (-) Transcript_19281:618-1655(-)
MLAFRRSSTSLIPPSSMSARSFASSCWLSMAMCSRAFSLFAFFSICCCILYASASFLNFSANIFSSCLLCSLWSWCILICCCSTWCVSLSFFFFFSALLWSLSRSLRTYSACACCTRASTCASSCAARLPRSPAMRSACFSLACLSASLSARIRSCFSAISICSRKSRASSSLSRSFIMRFRSRSFSFSTSTLWYASCFRWICRSFSILSSLICRAKSLSMSCSSCSALSAASFLRCCTACRTWASASLSDKIFWCRSSSCLSLSFFHCSYLDCWSSAASFSCCFCISFWRFRSSIWSRSIWRVLAFSSSSCALTFFCSSKCATSEYSVMTLHSSTCLRGFLGER